MDVDEEFEPPTSSSSKGDKKRFEVKKVSWCVGGVSARRPNSHCTEKIQCGKFSHNKIASKINIEQKTFKFMIFLHK